MGGKSTPLAARGMTLAAGLPALGSLSTLLMAIGVSAFGLPGAGLPATGGLDGRFTCAWPGLARPAAQQSCGDDARPENGTWKGRENDYVRCSHTPHEIAKGTGLSDVCEGVPC